MKRIPIFIVAILLFALSAQAAQSSKLSNPMDANNNMITYTANEQLPVVSSSYESGLHADSFNVSITIHHFENGIGQIVFDGDLTRIGGRAFIGCSGLTSIFLPSSVTSIGEWAFYRCSSLDSIAIPDSVTSIGGVAFGLCSSLTSVVIPSNVTSIGEVAFTHCTSLSTITCKAITPPACGDSVFNHVPNTCILYVPCNSKSSYMADATWGQFQQIECMAEEPEETDIESLESESAEQNTRKILRDGQVIILRDGEEYTILGQKL